MNICNLVAKPQTQILVFAIKLFSITHTIKSNIANCQMCKKSNTTKGTLQTQTWKQNRQYYLQLSPLQMCRSCANDPKQTREVCHGPDIQTNVEGIYVFTNFPIKTFGKMNNLQSVAITQLYLSHTHTHALAYTQARSRTNTHWLSNAIRCTAQQIKGDNLCDTKQPHTSAFPYLYTSKTLVSKATHAKINQDT